MLITKAPPAAAALIVIPRPAVFTLTFEVTVPLARVTVVGVVVPTDAVNANEPFAGLPN